MFSHLNIYFINVLSLGFCFDLATKHKFIKFFALFFLIYFSFLY